jgi:alkanesulfonate monooxygenase SsuD/methylene tetrahydromethanopterin reductase-like flavin-dependent oxidoreductase (luciferase family)
MSEAAERPSQELHLGFWMLVSGGHIGSWRHPSSRPETLLGIDHYVEITRIAARGKFDMVFFEDTLGARERNGGIFGEASVNSLDPVVQIAALAGATQDIGLAASYSTTYHPPQILADKFDTVQRLSGGRAAWNMVTSGDIAARNFGSGKHPERAVRYAQAHETVETVKSLWAGGPDLPGGEPVLIQAGMSKWGLDFAATYGEGIFAMMKDVESGRAFRANLRRLAMEKGRSPDGLKILPGFMSLIGSTTAEVQDKQAFYRDLIHPALLRGMLGERFNFDFTDYPLDQPFPMAEILEHLEERPIIGGNRARFVEEIQPGDTIAAYAERTARKLSNHITAIGTPEDVADTMQTWLQAGGCDGFVMQALQIPVELELFVDEVVPILQRRGLQRADYRGATLRDHLGLVQTDRGVMASA